MTNLIGGFSLGGAIGQLMNAFAAQAHPQMEMHYLTVAIYCVAAAICFKKVPA